MVKRIETRYSEAYRFMRKSTSGVLLENYAEAINRKNL
jgi:hypothetical protein